MIVSSVICFFNTYLYASYFRLCTFCGVVHVPGRKHCSAFGKKCGKCGMKNHNARVCRRKSSRGKFHSDSDAHHSDDDTCYDDYWDM